MHTTVIQSKQFSKFTLTKLAKKNSSTFEAGIFFRTSKIQLLAVKDINDRWMLTEQCTAPFLRRVDINLIYYPHIEANEKKYCAIYPNSYGHNGSISH